MKDPPPIQVDRFAQIDCFSRHGYLATIAGNRETWSRLIEQVLRPNRTLDPLIPRLNSTRGTSHNVHSSSFCWVGEVIPSLPKTGSGFLPWWTNTIEAISGKLFHLSAMPPLSGSAWKVRSTLGLPNLILLLPDLHKFDERALFVSTPNRWMIPWALPFHVGFLAYKGFLGALQITYFFCLWT